MKERLLDVMKWGLIIIITGAVFYVVCPKYYFSGPEGRILFRCNKITGQIEWLHKGDRNYWEGEWVVVGEHWVPTIDELEKKYGVNQ